MGFWPRVKQALANVSPGKWKVVKRYPLPENGRPPGACDDILVRLDGLAISLTRKTSSTLPHEVTVVIPRAEMQKKYQDGKLVETNLVYSSITVSHSPRFPPSGSSAPIARR